MIRTAPLLAALLLAACSDSEQKEPSALPEPVPEPLPVEVAWVGPGEIRSILEGQGRLVASQRMELVALVGGRLAELPVADGQRVMAGDLIARLEALPSVRADLADAEREVEARRRELERLEKAQALAEGLIAGRELDNARDQLRTAEARRDRLLAEEAHRRIVAPFAGVLAAIEFLPGAHVGAGTSIATLHATDAFRVELDLPETAFTQLAIGRPATVTPLAGTATGAVIRALPGTVDPDSGTGTVVLVVEPAPDDWRPGGFVTVTCEIERTTGPVRLPRSGLFRRDNRPYAWRVEANPEPAGHGKDAWLAERTWLRLGPGDRTHVLVEEGLEVNDLVVVDGAHGLRDAVAVDFGTPPATVAITRSATAAASRSATASSGHAGGGRQ